MKSVDKVLPNVQTYVASHGETFHFGICNLSEKFWGWIAFVDLDGMSNAAFFDMISRVHHHDGCKDEEREEREHITVPCKRAKGEKNEGGLRWIKLQSSAKGDERMNWS